MRPNILNLRMVNWSLSIGTNSCSDMSSVKSEDDKKQLIIDN